MSEAVGYTRISEKDQSNNSLDNQQIGITQYCANNNLTLNKIFIDNGRSAFTFDRPEWLKLESYIKQNKNVKYLIIYHIDRFSRATLMDALIKLHEIEEKLKVKVLTVNDSITQDNTDLSIQMMRTINLLFANNERNRIQDRVKDGVYRSLSSGRFCNKAPIGYLNSKDSTDKPLLVIDKEKAPHIKEIFKLYNGGLNVESIRSLVPQLKLKGNSAVQRILSNSIYAGIIQLPAYKGKPAIEVKAIHEPIVPAHEYYRAVNKLNRKTITSQPNEEVWLRGLVHCYCSKKMTAGNSKGKSGKYYWYYKCNEHQENFSASKMHKQFLEILDVISFKDNDIDFFREKLQALIKDHGDNKGGTTMRLKLQLQKVEKKIKDVQAKFLLSETMEESVFKTVINELKEEKATIEMDLIKLNTTTSNMMDVLKEMLPKLSRLSSIFLQFPLHHQQLFISTIFSHSLSYFDGIYRTPLIHPLFADKELILKEKRLLIIEQPLTVGVNLPYCTQKGNPIEHMTELLAIFVA